MHGFSPVFAELIVPDNPSDPAAVLTVFKTGEVFWIPIDKDPEIYRSSPCGNAKTRYSSVTASISRESDDFRKRFGRDHVCFHSKIHPHCITTFRPCPGFEFKIEYESQRRFLIVQGLLYKKLPSICVFEFVNRSLTPIYTESLLSVADVSYCTYFQSLIFVPRASATAVCLIPILSPPPAKYEHRLIPEVCFAGSNLKRTVHISAGGRTRWHAVSWSDETCPTIIFWHFSPPGEVGKRSWECFVCDLVIPCFIYNLSIHPSKSQIGFLMEINGETAICVWQIEKRQISQYNIIVEGIEGITASRWIISTESSDVVYAVSAKTGYYEHRKDVVMQWRNPLFDLATVTRDSNGYRYFFGESGELRVIGPSEFFEGYEVENAKTRTIAPIALFRHYMTGDCDVLSCMHLHRCGHCRRPLLYPLVSTGSDGLTMCYCSPSCQEEHWSAFGAIHQKPDL
jgi:hypothetical protein